MTFCKVSPLWRTILYKARYYSRRVVVPNHLSSQNLISAPLLMEKEPYGKKCFLVAIMLAQKCESPGFQITWDISFEPTHFFLNSCCQIPSSVNNLTSHFPSKAMLLTSRSWSPSPPWSFTRQMTLHFVNRYFSSYYPLAKRILIGDNPIYVRLL
jgi:hypothetical protein